MEYKQTQQAIETHLRGLQDGNQVTEDEYGGISRALSRKQSDIRSQPVQEATGPIASPASEAAGGNSEVREEAGRNTFETSDTSDVEIHLRSDRKPESSESPSEEMQFPMVLDDELDPDVSPEWSTAIHDMNQDPEFVQTMGLGKIIRDFAKKRKPRKPFNVHPMGSPGENDQFLRNFVDKYVDENMEFTEPRTTADVLEEAKADPRDPRKLDPAEFDQSAMIVKMRLYTLASSRRAIDAVLKAEANPTPENIKAYKEAWVDMGNHMEREKELKAGPARTTRMMGVRLDEDNPIKELQEQMFTDNSIERAMGAPVGSTDLQTIKILAESVRQDMKDVEVINWAEKAKDVIGWKDLFLGTMYPFMLSSLKTWGPMGANVLSNINILVNYPAAKLAGAAMSPVRRASRRVFSNDKDRIAYQEAVRSLAVLRHALPEALQFAWQTFKTNQPAGGQKTKLDAPQHLSKGEDVWTSENLREFFENIHENPANKDKYFQQLITPQTVKEGGAFAMLIDSWGKLLSASGRGLKGGDEFFKTFGRRLGQIDQAYRNAFKDLQSRAITQGEFEQAVSNYLSDPRPNMKDAGETLAEFLTLQQDLGKFGQSADKMRDAGVHFGIPWGRIVIPFLKVMVNSAKYNLSMVNMTGDSLSDLRGLNGGAAQDMALGRLVVSAGYATTAGLLATSFWHNDGAPGVMLFGYGSSGTDMPDPENQKALREIEMNAGFRPCSLVYQDEDGGRHAYQFSKIEPLGTYMCTVADIAANWDDIKGYAGDAELGKLMMTAYAVGHNNLISKSWAKSIHELMKVGVDLNDRTAGYFDNLVGMVIPRIVADFKITAGDEYYREAQHSVEGLTGAWEQIKKQIPGLSKTLPIKRGIWYQPLFNHGQWGPDHFSSFKYTLTEPDMVDEEMMRLRMPMKNVPYRMEGVKLHPRVRHRWMQLANEPSWTESATALGLSQGELVTGKKAVEQIIQSPTYRNATEEERIEFIKKEIQARRGFARILLFEPAGQAQIDPVITEYQPDLLTDIAEAKALNKNVGYQLGESKAANEGQLAAPSNTVDLLKRFNPQVQ